MKILIGSVWVISSNVCSSGYREGNFVQHGKGEEMSSCLWSCLSIGARQVWWHLILLIIHFLCIFELHALKLLVQPFSCDLHTKFSLLWSEYIVLQSKWFLMLDSLTARIHCVFSSKVMPTSRTSIDCCTRSCCWTKCGVDQCIVLCGQGWFNFIGHLSWWYCNESDVGTTTPFFGGETTLDSHAH